MNIRCLLLGHNPVPGMSVDTELENAWAIELCDRCGEAWLDKERDSNK